MAKVIALTTQVDANGVSRLPNEIFEVEDKEKLNGLIFNQCVELYQEPQEEQEKKTGKKLKD